MVLLVFSLLSVPLGAAEVLQAQQGPATEQGYLARIELNSPDEVHNALKRAEMLFLEGSLQGDIPPVQFVLHGPEVAIFFKENYKKHRELLDLAAKLTAFGVINIKVCETRMGVLGRKPSGLLHFVGTVPFGPVEVERLIKAEEYVYF